MDLLREYEFDALPYIDKEYDHPLVQEAVHKLISDEMRTFKPQNYLHHLPYPQLKHLNDSIPPQPLPKIDTTRYLVEGPPPALEKDVNAWRKSINNAKSQIEHQTNNIINLELFEKNSASVWLEYNESLEGSTKYVHTLTNNLKRKIDTINAQRKVEQETARFDLGRTLQKRGI